MDTSPSSMSNVAWLKGTYWYCPKANVPAIQTQKNNQFQWMQDQTVWFVSGAKHGYFWGITSALFTPMDETPDVSNKSDSTFFATVNPEGRTLITFINTQSGSTVTGSGDLVVQGGQPSFSMQMASGPSAMMAVHWAYMLPITPTDPEWQNLPGANVSVEAMLSGIEPPTVVGPEDSES